MACKQTVSICKRFKPGRGTVKTKCRKQTVCRDNKGRFARKSKCKKGTKSCKRSRK